MTRPDRSPDLARSGPPTALVDAWVAWCWARLTSAHEGMLTFETARRAAALPVPCAVDHGQILVALAPTNTAGWRAAGHEAALVVAGTDGDGSRWSVRASGPAERQPADEHDAGLLASTLDRPRLNLDPQPFQLVLTAVRVRGCYETPARDASAAADPSFPHDLTRVLP